MGRLPEGLEELDRGRRLAEEDGTPELAGYALFYAAEAHYHAHDADRALASARQLEEINRRLGEPPVWSLRRSSPSAMHTSPPGGLPTPSSRRVPLSTSTGAWRSKRWHGRDGSWPRPCCRPAICRPRSPRRRRRSRSASARCAAIYEAAAHGVMARALLRRDGARPATPPKPPSPARPR